MRIYITGAGGLVGSDIAPELEAAGHEVWGRERVEICDESAILDAIGDARPQWVVHLAAFTDVDGAESREDEAMRVNAGGTRNVARAARRAGARLLVLSTDYVYDGEKPSPYVENDPVRPISAYGRSKLAAERAACKESVDALIVRTGWVFGPGGRNFVDTIRGLAAERDVLDVVDDQRGCPTYTAHLATALRRLLERGAYGAVHAAGAGSATWFEFAQEILRQIDADPGVIRRTTSAAFARPAPRPRNSVLSCERYRALVGELLPAWQEGLRAHLIRQNAEVIR